MVDSLFRASVMPLVAMLVAAVVLPAAVARAAPLDPNMHHLRWGVPREWEEFPPQAESAELVVPFTSTANQTERTLRIRHRDLRQAWEIVLNDKKLATLPRDVPDTVTCWAIAPGRHRSGRTTS